MTEEFAIAIIGGGIVGLATTLALRSQHPDLLMVLVEKEPQVGTHQTGHNSGVIHSGIYYKPGSLKAELCVRGARHMVEFCTQNGIPIKQCGKVIVATEERELQKLDALYERAIPNGVPGIEKIGPERLREIEPNATGLGALYSPSSAVVDYRQVAQTMKNRIQQLGVKVETSARVTGVKSRPEGVCIETVKGEVICRWLVNCAGLQSDLVAQMMGLNPDVRIIPFRGEYYFLKPERNHLVNGLVYPVPDPSLPFLGVHFTRTADGKVEAGPNAVLAFAREGYRMGTVNFPEMATLLQFPGFWRMAKYWQVGLYEFYRSLSKKAFVRALRKLVPGIQEQDLTRGGAGIRAQAVSTRGQLIDDFQFVDMPRALHVLNAPSPAATASLAIGRHIAAHVDTAFDLNNRNARGRIGIPRP